MNDLSGLAAPAASQPYLKVKQDAPQQQELEHTLFQSILDNAPIGIWLVDIAGKVLFINKNFCTATGISEQAFLAAGHYADVLPLSVSENCLRSDRELIAQRATTHLSNEWLPFADGKEHLLEITKVKLFDQEGNIKGLLGLATDITLRREAEAHLQLAASVFTNASEGIMITDAGGAIIAVNDSFTHITGFSREEALGKNPRILQSGHHGPEFYPAMWHDLANKGHWRGEMFNRHKNGGYFTEMLSINAVHDVNGVVQNYVSMFTDVTSIKDHARQLEHIAHHDRLTTLPNRVLLIGRMRHAMASSLLHGQSVAIAYMDLDDFKAINDQHGRIVGDNLLITIVQRLTAALRDGDTLARIGSDEFVVVLEGLAHPGDCDPVILRLLQAAAGPLLINDHLCQISASIGVAFDQQDGTDADQLLRQANQAMYQAKEAGKNRYQLFDFAEDEAIKTRHENLQQIRQALEQHEFVLHYQPKVNMRTGAVVGVEALVRWRHPERGLLPPAAFLPLVENHPISIELGEWVIASALSQMHQWSAVGLDLPVSVNIGARQLQHNDFVARVRTQLAAYPTLPAGSLEIEVLETNALEDMVQVSEIMCACRALGVRFALDDFGTGYSSLAYLKHLPVDLLKIDQSFVRDMLEDPDDMTIVEAVIGLANSFRRNVIAEGVETVRHGEWLLALGCELAQGYGIARPMPAASLPGWVTTWRPDTAWTTAP